MIIWDIYIFEIYKTSNIYSNTLVEHQAHIILQRDHPKISTLSITHQLLYAQLVWIQTLYF